MSQIIFKVGPVVFEKKIILTFPVYVHVLEKLPIDDYVFQRININFGRGSPKAHLSPIILKLGQYSFLEDSFFLYIYRKKKTFCPGGYVIV